MKCPSCSTDHKAKYGLICSCGYRFTFDPKAPKTFKFTDGKFMAAYQKASQNGTAAFTFPQLYSAYVSFAKSDRWLFVLFSVVAGIFGVFMLWSAALLAIIAFGVSALFLSAAIFHSPNVVGIEVYRQFVRKWLDAGKELDGLITEPSLGTPPPAWKEQDIYDYGVERILVVERDLLVDLFVLNNLHAENRALVIAESGYPNYLIPVANRLLSERSDLPVFLLHDATQAGVQMVQRIKAQNWLQCHEHPITDIGFQPSHFKQLKRTKNYEYRNEERTLPVDALQTLFLAEGLSLCFQHNFNYTQVLEQKATDASGGNYG